MKKSPTNNNIIASGKEKNDHGEVTAQFTPPLLKDVSVLSIYQRVSRRLHTNDCD